MKYIWPCPDGKKEKKNNKFQAITSLPTSSNYSFWYMFNGILAKCKTNIHQFHVPKVRKIEFSGCKDSVRAVKLNIVFFIVFEVPVVIIQNAGLHQTIQNNRGLTKTIPKTMPYRCLQDHANDKGRSFYQSPFGQPQILTSPRILQEISCFWPFHAISIICCSDS